ncbi:DUF4262 domain-containing protein [Micromonospora andamanensis]|uniref:DUF4262 domain-containing protein n=1 Tax=Micromonospora andamanensis TaxID=1287068 RepID=A0ABQ4HS06_9ACTN|nr:DUF4262 domain-containing protein [Micromonospora andamanensis]GIJ08407.1 hypothetical protein Van01_16210 [Micromonospora andamanensis]
MTGIEDFLHHQSEIIDRVGWAVTAVHPHADDTDHHAPFAYTVGLTAHNHPELLVAGLDPAISQHLLNDLAARVYDRAERFTHGQRIGDLIAGYDAVVIDGTPTAQLHPGAAIARYGQQVRVQQVVWPDPEGRFPWDAGYAYPPSAQPTLRRP